MLSDLQLHLLPLHGMGLAATASAPEIAHGIVAHLFPHLRVGQDRAETDEHLAHHDLRAVLLAEARLKIEHGVRGDVGELPRPDEREQVKLQVLPVRVNRGALKLVLGGLDPLLASLLEGDALARRDMHALPHIDLDLGMEGLGVLLALEMLGVALTVLVCVVNNPGFLLLRFFALPSLSVQLASRRPTSLPDGHDLCAR